MANPKVTPITSNAVAKAKINLPVDINEQMAAEIAAMQSRISAPSGDRIAATQQKTFKLPNGTEVNTLECIIVDFAAAYMYYAAAYDRNNITPPDCFALGLEPASLTPSNNSPNKQAESCSGCPQNQFGSAGKGKACSNTRLLGLLPTDADINTPMMILKVSPTGIRAFDAHVNSVVRSYSMPLRGVVTEISFDPTSDYATMRFRAIGPASKDLVMLAQSRKDEAITRLLTEPDVSAAVVAPPKSRKPAAARR
jgi:hypothetical protein